MKDGPIALGGRIEQECMTAMGSALTCAAWGEISRMSRVRLLRYFGIMDSGT